MKLKVLLMSAMMLGFTGMTSYTYAQDKPAAQTITQVTKSDFTAAIAAFEKEDVSRANFGTLNKMMMRALGNSKQAHAQALDAGNDKEAVKAFNSMRQQEAIYNGVHKAFSEKPVDKKAIISQLKQFAETL